MAEQGASASVALQRRPGRQILRSATVREVLMGAQDNLTNVLAVVLGVTIGAGRADFVALAGLSAGVAEAVLSARRLRFSAAAVTVYSAGMLPSEVLLGR